MTSGSMQVVQNHRFEARSSDISEGGWVEWHRKHCQCLSGPHMGGSRLRRYFSTEMRLV